MLNEQPRPPGTYRWDGQTFRPAPPLGAGRLVLVLLVAIVPLLVGYAIGRAAAPSTSTNASTSTAAPAATAPPTAVPTLAPTPIALSGQGSKVLPVTLAAGRYKVTWQAQGHDNFIVRLLGDNQVGMVNEIPPDPSSGETVLTVRDAGSYQIQVEAATLTWSITLDKL